MPDTRELRVAWGFNRQAALQTALAVGSLWSLNQSNDDFGFPRPNHEDNANDKGKGTPFPTQRFKTTLDSSTPWNYYLTSQNAAMLAVFGLGKVSEAVEGANGGVKYVCAPNVVLAAANDDMPSTSNLVTVRQGASDVVDHLLIGMCCEEFTITVTRGPGRENATMTSSWVGCGKYTKPSGIVQPALTVEHELNAGGVSILSLFGTDLLPTKRFEQFTFTVKNNIRLDRGYYPGSGSQLGYQLRGRMLRGPQQITASYQALLEDGSPEFDAVLAGTQGVFRMKMEGPQIGAGPEKHYLDITLPKVQLLEAPFSADDGLMMVTAGMSVQDDPAAVDRVLKMEVVTNKAGIGELPA